MVEARENGMAGVRACVRVCVRVALINRPSLTRLTHASEGRDRPSRHETWARFSGAGWSRPQTKPHRDLQKRRNLPAGKNPTMDG